MRKEIPIHDVLAGLTTRIEALIANGKLQAPQLMREELDAVGTPALKSWARSQRGLFVPLARELQTEAGGIQSRYPDLADARSGHESAGPWVIALGACCA